MISMVIFDNPVAWVVLALSVVQSVFGVGLLLFGTPTLMLLGIGFGPAIGILLPCSLVISLTQLTSGLPRDRALMQRFATTALPMICLGLAVALRGLDTRLVAALLGMALLALGAMRCFPPVMAWFTRQVTRHTGLYLAGMGLVHGVSNMGGGLLVVMAGTLSHDKKEIRAIIAAGYALFAMTQIASLYVLHPQYFDVRYVLLPLLSLTAYAFGGLVFRWMSSSQFNHLLTAMIFIYGVLTLGKSFRP